MNPQHRAVSAVEPGVIRGRRRPQAGPIAVVRTSAQSAGKSAGEPAAEPASDGQLHAVSAAVRAGGGELLPLSEATRGLVWLSNDSAAALGQTLADYPGIQWVQLPFAGVDSFAGVIRRSSEHSVPLFTSAKGAYAQPVAEHALTLILALLRHIPMRVEARSWATGQKIGRSLYGMHVVIVGAGGIAVELMRLLSPFGVTLTIVRRRSTAVAGAHSTLTAEHLAEILPTADVVVLAAAATPETRCLFGAAQFATMKSDSIVINVARGALIDTDALVQALACGIIGGAGLDVTDPEPLPEGHPLWSEPRVIITPHTADTPAMTGPLFAERVRENVQAFLNDGRFIGVVDPDLGY